MKFTSQYSRRAAMTLIGASAAAPLLIAAGAQAQTPLQLDVPYVPTPQDLVDRMLEIVKPTASDFVMDLGCGDGRMLVTAAAKFGARGRGVDLNPVRITEAIENARKANVADKVTFEVKNLFQTSIAEATDLTMYLLPSVNLQLRPRILTEMRPGSRIVSHAFHMADWEPDLQDEVRGRNIYHWVVPARVAGKWNLRDGSDEIVLDVYQQFQKINGSARKEGGPTGKVSGRIKGDEITFDVDLGKGPKTYKGRISADSIDGTGGESWRAQYETRLNK
jgi:hypothetical protein